MSFISFTRFCISFRTSFIKFYKFYNVLYGSRKESAPWATPGEVPWPAGASLAKMEASVSETAEPDMQCRSFSDLQCSGPDVSARLRSAEAQGSPRKPTAAQRGPEGPREAQNKPGRLREAQRGPESFRES